jgi:sialate O-acetylesterase
MENLLFSFRRNALRVIWAILALAVTVRGDVRLPRIFTDNMMLQRDAPVQIWGWAAPGEAVKVTLADYAAETVANDNGQWAVALPALREGENLALTVTGGNTLTLKNILAGDIWLCAGQSNMEMALAGCLGAAEDIKASDIPKIRRIKFAHATSIYREDDAPTQGPWQVCTPAVSGGFTAAGFYFAREIVQRTGVPVGILDVNWGGTKIEPWTPLEGLDMVPALKPVADAQRKALASYGASLPQALAALELWLAQSRTALERDPLARLAPMPAWPSAANAAGWGGMYNAMVHPLVRLPIKGTLWYQGESNGGEGDIYLQKMCALISGWRKLWELPPPQGAGMPGGALPFYFVQLASYQRATDTPAGGDGWARLREAQTRALAMPNTGMAVLIDIGDAGDIHPRNKFDVGLRLARWALARDYGLKDTVVSGPLFREMKIENGKVRVRFDHVGTGLMVGRKTGRDPAVEDKTGKLRRFAVAGVDKVWQWADAVIEADAVIVSSPKVPAPVAVRYAFAHNPEGANLYNREGLPASPFHTDDW